MTTSKIIRFVQRMGTLDQPASLGTAEPLILDSMEINRYSDGQGTYLMYIDQH